MAVEQDIWDALVAARQNENLQGAMVFLAFADPGGRRLEFIKAFPPGASVAEVVGILEVAKRQVIGNEVITEWSPP